MPTADIGELTLHYDTSGAASYPTAVLVAGLGNQSIYWSDEMVAPLAGAGFHIVRFDNRDVGHSTKLDHLGAANVMAVFAAIASGRTPPVGYDLAAMAHDVAGLLDHLGVASAHIVGQSMGGMIAQRMAVDHPDRVRSLTSIMSTTGDPSVGHTRPEAAGLVMKAPADGRDAAIEATVESVRITWGPRYFDERRARRRAAEAYDRAFHPPGVGRQFAALLADGDRTRQLRSVDVPTLVIHGDADPLIDVSGGEATAAAIPGARLEILEDMGHDLPPELWPGIANLVIDHWREAEEAA